MSLPNPRTLLRLTVHETLDIRVVSPDISRLKSENEGDMPIYEYQCESCSAALEVLQKASDPAPSSCEKCGKGPMVKQMSLSSFALKGTGWYVTDFRGGNGNPNGASSKSSTETAKTETAGEAKTEVKSESSTSSTAPSAPSTDTSAKS